MSAELTNPHIYVVDDENRIRELIATALEKKGYSVEQFSSGEELLDVCNFPDEGCILLDNHMPGLKGLTVQQELKKNTQFNLPIIFISGESDIRDVVNAMQGGAVSFLEKPFSLEELFISVKNALIYSKESARQKVFRERLATLTSREKNVYDLIIKGCTIKSIAKALGISESTVEFHRRNILHKMECETIAKLMAKVIEYGIHTS